jgi:hypothetical protein
VRLVASKWIIEFVNGSTKEFPGIEYDIKTSVNGSKLFVYKKNNYGPDDIYRTFLTAQVIGWWKEEATGGGY